MVLTQQPTLLLSFENLGDEKALMEELAEFDFAISTEESDSGNLILRFQSRGDAVAAAARFNNRVYSFKKLRIQFLKEIQGQDIPGIKREEVKRNEG